ncbi:MAG: epoxyqueuosine reductase QueH [Anaerovoracaceae bacterium]
MNKKVYGRTLCPCSDEIAAGSMDSGMNLRLERPSLLLHSCCGPCSTAVLERLVDDYNVTVYFYNPNITDEAEYRARLDAQKQVISYFNSSRFLMEPVGLIEGEYCPVDYFDKVKGFENEPEGGARCSLCFEMRLRASAECALQRGFEMFATTLTVSPHKNYRIISAIGNSISEEMKVGYLDMDFKKKAGFQRSVELSKEIGLYRQNYCGCEFSKWFLK